MTTPIKSDLAAIDQEARAEPNDAEIIARVRAGDDAAFERMFRENWEQLYRFAYRYLRSPDDAEEAVQTVFARIWRSRCDWHVRGPLASYLYLATRNASLDRLKHDAIAESRRGSTNELAARAAAHAADHASEYAAVNDADAALRTAEVEAGIERSLAELPPKRRVICELRFRQNLSYAEIAQQLGISTKTVETQIARGAKFLRERLRHFLD